MAYEILIDEKKRILELKVSGQTDFAENNKSRQEVLNLCKEKNISKILVNMTGATVNEDFSVPELAKFGSTWKESAINFDYKFACIYPKNYTARDSIGFAATVSANNGLKIKLFNNSDEGRSWLLR